MWVPLVNKNQPSLIPLSSLVALLLPERAAAHPLKASPSPVLLSSPDSSPPSTFLPRSGLPFAQMEHQGPPIFVSPAWEKGDRFRLDPCSGEESGLGLRRGEEHDIPASNSTAWASPGAVAGTPPFHRCCPLEEKNRQPIACRSWFSVAKPLPQAPGSRCLSSRTGSHRRKRSGAQDRVVFDHWPLLHSPPLSAAAAHPCAASCPIWCASRRRPRGGASTSRRVHVGGGSSSCSESPRVEGDARREKTLIFYPYDRFLYLRVSISYGPL